MLIRKQIIEHKNANAIYRAATDLVRGMVVEADHDARTVTAATGVPTHPQFVDQNADRTGIYSVQGELSEFEPVFETIQANDLVVLEQPLPGERYATDQFTGAAPEIGKCLVVDNGKLKSAASETTGMVFIGTEVFKGRTFWLIQITPTVSA